MIGREVNGSCGQAEVGQAEKVKKTWFSRFISVTIFGVQNASLCALFAGEVVHRICIVITQLSELCPELQPLSSDTSGEGFSHCQVMKEPLSPLQHHLAAPFLSAM